MYDMKALYEATSVENAVELRLEHPEAQIIAGGSDVLVQMREGKRAGKELISIYGLDELRGITIDENENIRIGSLTSFSHITRDPIIQKYINVLGEAVDQVGGPQIDQGLLYPRGTGRYPRRGRRDPDRDPDSEGELRKHLRTLHQVRDAQRDGHRDARLLGQRPAFGGQKDDRARPHCLRRGGSRADARAARGGGRKRSADQ